MNRFFPIILLLFSCGVQENRGTDLRELLIQSAQKSDPEFPDGESVVLTQFAYLGNVNSKDGKIYVANLRSVLGGMPAPRGVNYIEFFDRSFRFLGKLNYATSFPLWCDAGKLYLWGDLDGSGGEEVGNVVDLSEGYSAKKVYHEKKYGSSGGILDD